MNDISIDLETLSTRHDAAILSIGAVIFDRDTGEIGRRFYAEINISDAIKHGHVDASTLAWWISQGDAARGLFADTNDKVKLADALGALSDFVTDAYGACVWGNGATFDITILEHAYVRCGLTPPWQFWKIRDMRTLVETAWFAAQFDRNTIPFVGTPHHALHDAEHQAKVISTSWQATVTQQGVVS